ncbi:hypothetical protein HII28_02270 [Planctomonas sp. JC2975]|uniref:hypothetical protein n=1 Tax=Planctomonas sp. JC2975 TaxID=2729626 RepID=UPI001473865D|nr:hypothetical protein [Planctomonas sp. JC2975]NNC10713.1 hypothetical protein [Planctomonas sp. JC2975]
MIEPRPIRFDVDTWIVMRNDKVLPKAVIQRVHHRQGDRYLLFRWDIDPQKRQLMNVVDSLEKANDLVLYDPTPTGVTPFAGYPPTTVKSPRARP